MSPRRNGLLLNAGRFGLLGILVVLLVAFTALRPDTFGTWDNLRGILSNQVVVVFLALAATLPLIVGEFDLSIASTFTWSQAIVVGLVVEQGWSVPAAVTIAAGTAVVVGLLNGIAVVAFGVSSFIATLATGSILTGVTLAYTDGETIFGDAPEALTSIARSQALWLDLPVLYALVVCVALAFALARLPFGRRMYATGGNRRAAHLTGIATGRYVVSTFVASALLASVGGLLLGARVGAASSDVGQALLIPAFAGAFLGTTAFALGRFNVPGTLLAVYVVGVAVAGLEQLGAALWVEPVFQGVVLFLAVGLTAYTGRLRGDLARRARLRELEELADGAGRAEGARVSATAGSRG